MKAYVFQAALLCEHCAQLTKEAISRKTLFKVPADPTNESSYDSDDYPKGPYPNGGGESDSPQHCDHCGIFLENPLTADGVLYVNTLAIPYMDEKELAWSEIADRADADHKPALAEWIRYYFAWGQ